MFYLKVRITKILLSVVLIVLAVFIGDELSRADDVDESKAVFFVG